jgi:hypothetical protein
MDSLVPRELLQKRHVEYMAIPGDVKRCEPAGRAADGGKEIRAHDPPTSRRLLPFMATADQTGIFTPDGVPHSLPP